MNEVVKFLTYLVKLELHLTQCLLNPMEPLIGDGIGLEAFSTFIPSLTLLRLWLLVFSI